MVTDPCEDPLIFVYGTLMSDQPMHGLLGDAELVSRIRTAPRYELVHLGPYPALLRGGATSVRGELYRVPSTALPALDEYEGDQYERTEIELEDGSACQAWVLKAAG
jgi:gamma-glutamylcyclotransferase (GGCT)/AIG2-like uncharacterized protein YtfP